MTNRERAELIASTVTRAPETLDTPHLSAEATETLVYLLGRVEDFRTALRTTENAGEAMDSMFQAAKWARAELNREAV